MSKEWDLGFDHIRNDIKDIVAEVVKDSFAEGSKQGAEEGIKQSKKEIEKATKELANLKTKLEKTIEKEFLSGTSLKIGEISIDKKNLKEFEDSAKQMLATAENVANNMKKAAKQAKNAQDILKDINLNTSLSNDIKKVVPSSTKEEQENLSKLITAITKYAKEYDNALKKVTDDTSGEKAIVVAQEYINLMTEALDIIEKIKLESKDLINVNAITTNLVKVKAAISRSGNIFTKAMKPIEAKFNELLDMKNSLEISSKGITGERPNKENYYKKNIYPKTVDANKYDIEKYLNWDDENQVNTQKTLESLFIKLKTQSSLRSDGQAKFVGLLSKALAEAGLDVKHPELKYVVEKVNNYATQKALDYYKEIINYGSQYNKAYNPNLEKLANNMSERITSSTIPAPENISNPVVVDANEYDQLKKKAKQANNSVGNLKTTLKELADQQRKEGNVTDYDGNDWKYSKDSVERYAMGIKNLQNQISQTTDAKLLDDLNRDLEDAKINFIALYDTVNDVFDGKLNKNKSIKADIRNLYSSVVGEAAQFDTHFSERVAVALPASSTKQVPQIQNLTDKYSKLNEEIERWIDNNVNKQLYPPTYIFDDHDNAIQIMQNYIDKMNELKSNDGYSTLSQSIKDNVASTIEYFSNLITVEQKAIGLQERFKKENILDNEIRKMTGTTAGDEYNKYFDMLNQKGMEISEILEQVRKDFNLTFDDVSNKWVKLQNPSSSTPLSVEELTKAYLELCEVQEKINTIREKYPREDVEWYGGNPIDKSDFTQKGTLASVLKNYLKNDEVREILQNAKYNIEELNQIIKNYERAYHAEFWGEDFNNKSFEEQLKFLEDIAIGKKQGKQNYKELQSVDYSGYIAAELSDGTTKRLTSVDFDIGDTFHTYENNLKGNISSLKYVLEDSVEDLRYTVEYKLADFGNGIGYVLDDIQTIINDKVLELFKTDVGLKVFDNLDYKGGYAAPIDSSVEGMDYYGLIEQAEEVWKQTEEFKAYYEKYRSLINDIYNWNNQNVIVDKNTLKPVLKNTDNLEESISTMSRYQEQLRELISNNTMRNLLSYEESSNITKDFEYLDGLIVRTKALQEQMKSTPSLPLTETGNDLDKVDDKLQNVTRSASELNLALSNLNKNSVHMKSFVDALNDNSVKNASFPLKEELEMAYHGATNKQNMWYHELNSKMKFIQFYEELQSQGVKVKKAYVDFYNQIKPEQDKIRAEMQAVLDFKPSEQFTVNRDTVKRLLGIEDFSKYTKEELEALKNEMQNAINEMLSSPEAQGLDATTILSGHVIRFNESIETALKVTSLPLFEESSRQLSFVKETQNAINLIEEENGQMALFEGTAKKATETAIEGHMTLNDYISKNIEGQMTLNEVMNTPNKTRVSSDIDDFLIDDEILLEEIIKDMENVEKQADKTANKLNKLFHGKRPSISENPPRLKERYHDESFIKDIESGNVRLVKSYEEVEDVIRRIDSSKYKRNMYDLRTATLDYEPDGMKNLQQALGLFDEFGNRLVELNETGMTIKGAFITDDYAIRMLRRQTEGLDELIQKTKEAKNAGVQLAEIYGEFSTREGFYQIQEVGKGVNLFPSGSTKQRPLIEEQNDALKVKDEHIQKLIQDIQKLDSLGFKIDGISGNFMYDAEKGFTAIDLSLKNAENRALTLRDILLYVSNVMTGGYGNRGGIFKDENIVKTTELMAKVKQNFLSLGYSSKDINNTFSELFGDVINGYKMINDIDNLIDPEKIVPNEVFEKLDHLRTEIRDTEKLVKENENKVSKSKVSTWANIEEANKEASNLSLTSMMGGGFNFRNEISEFAYSYEKQFGILPEISKISEDILRKLADEYALSVDVNKNAQTELELAKNKLEVLEKQYIQQKQIAELIWEDRSKYISEEKKHKYTIASRENVPNISKAVRWQEIDLSTFAADTIVENEKKQQEAAENTAKVKQEEAKAVEDANNRIVESNKKAEESGKKKKESTASNVLGSFGGNNNNNFKDVNFNADDAKVLKQIETSAGTITVYKTAIGQIATVLKSLDGSEGVTSITTNFEELKKEIEKTFALIVKLKDELKIKQNKFGDNFDSSAYKNSIAKEQARLEGYMMQADIYAAEKRYAIEAEQMLRDYAEVRDNILDKQARKDSVYNAQILQNHEKELSKLEQFKSQYTKKLSSVNNVFSYLSEYSDVENAINSLTNIEGIGNVETAFNKLENAINSFKQNVKSSASLDPVFSTIKKKNDIDNIVESYKLSFEQLGFSSDKAKQQVENLISISSKIKSIDLTTTTGITDFGKEVHNFNVEEDKIKNLIKITKQRQQVYDQNYDKIKKYEQEHIKLNELYMREQEKGSSAKLTADIEVQKQKVSDLKNEAIAASKEINKMFKAGSISKGQRDSAINTVTNVYRGNTPSDTASNTVKSEQHTAAIENVEDLISKLEKAGDYTSDLQQKAINLWAELNKPQSAENLLNFREQTSALTEEFNELKNAHDAAIQKQKEAQNQYNENIKVIKQLETETDKLNNMMASDMGKGRMTHQIEDQFNNTVKAAENAKKAIQDVDQMFAQGRINAGQHTDAGKAYREAKQGSTTSQAKYEDAKAAQALRDEKEAADALKKSLDSLVSAYATLAADSKGKRTITLEEDIKQVQKARTEFANTRAEAENLGLSLDKISNLEKEAFSNLQTKVAKSGATTIDGYIDSLNKLEEKMRQSGNIGQQSFNNLQGMRDTFALIQSNKDLSSFDGIQEYLRKVHQLGSELPQIMKEIETLGKIEGIQSQANFFDQLNVKSQTYKSTLSELKKKLDEFNKVMASGDKKLIDKAQIDLLNQAVPLINKLGKEAQGKGNLVEESIGQVKDVASRNQAMLEYAQSLGFTQKVSQGLEQENGLLTMTFKNSEGQILKMTGSIDKYNNALRQTSVVSKGAANFVTNLKASFRQMLGYFTRYYTGYMLITRVISTFRQGINIVKEFDAAMTELHKVSKDTTEALKNFEMQSFNIAETIGSTGKEIVNSAAAWEKLGYAIKDASELAKNSALYSNVGDMDINTATEHMVSTLKAYKEFDAQSSQLIVDKFNEIGNNYAITSEGIGAALERSAATLVAAGNDLDQSIALITAGNIITQDPESVGNAIKVVSMRLRGAKAELEEAGEETEGLVESTSKLQKKIMALTGVDIMIDDSTFKSTYEILLEISKVWDDLSDVNRASVLEVIAGKTRGSVVAGLLQQGDTLENVLEDSQNSEGSALEENQKYLKSIQGHLDLLNNQWQKIWTSSLTRETMNWFIDRGTDLLKIVEKIGLVWTTVITAGILTAGKALVKTYFSGGRVKPY